MSNQLKKTLVVITLCTVCCGISINSFAGKSANPHMKQIEAMDKFLGLMNNYLTLTEKWKKMISDKDTSIIMAIQSIKEIHEEKGDKLKAIPELRQILDQYKSKPIIKRAILFEIKNIYKDAKQYDKALAVTREILKGN